MRPSLPAVLQRRPLALQSTSWTSRTGRPSTKFTVHFWLEGPGVAPADPTRENSGHHHLLIDTELPPVDGPIPSDFNHLHFGAGQTESRSYAHAGRPRYQLLLGDKNHVPMSPPLFLIVSMFMSSIRLQPRQPKATSHSGRRVAPEQVYFVLSRGRGVRHAPPVVRFGLVGMGVAPAGFEKANTGHHHLLIDTSLPPFDQPIPNDFNHLHFWRRAVRPKPKSICRWVVTYG